MPDSHPLSQGGATPPDEVYTFVSDTAAQVHHSITLADQKAGFLFATVTAVLAFLHTDGATVLWQRSLHSGVWSLSDVLASVAVLGLVSGGVGALWVVLPRVCGGPRGLVAPWQINRYETAQQYAAEVRAAAPQALIQAKLEYCWVLSQINKAKYRAITFALWCSFVGLVAALAYLVVSPHTHQAPVG